MPRALIWVQHLLGIGHLRRAVALAAALAESGAEVRCVSGGMPVAGLDTGAARLLQLAAARVADARYRELLDAAGRPVDDAWRRARRRHLLAIFAAFRPHVVITETYPFGRGLLREELDALVAAVANADPRPLLLCSLRDIVEPRASVGRRERMVAHAREVFDRVLVHVDPTVMRLEDSLPEARVLADRLTYTGYLASDPSAPGAARESHAEVLVSAGGGRVGEALLRAALGAARASVGLTWRLLAGPGIADPAFEALRDAAPAGSVVERNRRDFGALLAACRVSVSQAGYNTMVDLLRARARAVVVPFAEAGELEQGIRARLFAARGLVRVLEPERLSATTLAAAVQSAAASERPAADRVALNGAERGARWIFSALERR